MQASCSLTHSDYECLVSILVVLQNPAMAIFEKSSDGDTEKSIGPSSSVEAVAPDSSMLNRGYLLRAAATSRPE